MAAIVNIDNMEITTIQLSKEMKKKLSSFGTKEESYEDIIRKIYSIAVKAQLRDFLMSSEDCISLDDARAELEKEWPRLK